MDSMIGVPFERITPKTVIPAKPSPPQISRCLQRGFPHLRPIYHLPANTPRFQRALGTGNKYPWSLGTRRTSRTFERNRTVFDGVLVVAFEQPAIATAERSRPSCRRISSCRSRRGRPGGWEHRVSRKKRAGMRNNRAAEASSATQPPSSMIHPSSVIWGVQRDRKAIIIE